MTTSDKGEKTMGTYDLIHGGPAAPAIQDQPCDACCGDPAGCHCQTEVESIIEYEYGITVPGIPGWDGVPVTRHWRDLAYVVALVESVKHNWEAAFQNKLTFKIWRRVIGSELWALVQEV